MGDSLGTSYIPPSAGAKSGIYGGIGLGVGIFMGSLAGPYVGFLSGSIAGGICDVFPTETLFTAQNPRPAPSMMNIDGSSKAPSNGDDSNNRGSDNNSNGGDDNQ
jgi:hypothetical protein